jgi:hypothetical protein
MPITVDETGKKEIEKIHDSSCEAALEVQKRSQQRLAHSLDSNGAGTQYIVGMAGFGAAGEA